MLENLYENIGEKIKNWAKWIFVIETIIAILAGLVIIFTYEDLLLYGFLCLVLGPIIALVGSWLLYAFGELVEDVHAIRYNPQITNIDKNIQLLATPIINENKETAKCEAEEIKRHFPDNYWICEKCNAQNTHTKTDCWYCGNPK